MPFCPVCLSEFRKEFTRCKECDSDLVDTLEPEMELSNENIKKALDGKELVPVMRGTLDVVQETHQLLASHRIASVIAEDSESDQSHGHTPRIRLLVSSEDLGKTSTILGDNFRRMLEMEGVIHGQELSYDRCPACQTPIPEDVTECPECGLFIDRV